MGLFDFLKTNNWQESISKIEKEITDSYPFKYFMDRIEEHKFETLLVKKYYTYILATAIYTIRSRIGLELNLKEITISELHEHFLRLTSELREKYLVSGKIKLTAFGNDFYIDKKYSLGKFFTQQYSFKEEIEQSLKTDEPYFTEIWNESEHEYDEEFGMVITGRKYHFKYLTHILLTKLVEKDDDILNVEEFELFELEDNEYKVMIDFVKIIRQLTNSK